MYEYNLTGYPEIIDDNTYLEQLKAVEPSVIAFVDTGENIKVQTEQTLLQSVLDGLSAVVPADVPINLQVKRSIRSAMAFGLEVIENAATENVLLGITEYGMTATVIRVLGPTNAALTTGSLYHAIDEIRAILPEDKDDRFITDARLLATINEIETYLGLELSTNV